MTGKSPPAWPPIITDARLSRAVLWRDHILTLAMWLLLLFLMRRGLYALWDETLETLGRARRGPEIDWDQLWERLQRYLTAVLLLCLWLLAWGIATLRRQQSLAGTTTPQPLSPAEQARDAGVSEADLAAWRSLRIMTVHIDANDRVSVVPGGAAPGAPTKD